MSHQVDSWLASARETLALIEQAGYVVHISFCGDCKTHHVFAVVAPRLLPPELQERLVADNKAIVELLYRRIAIVKAQKLVTHGH